MQARPTDHFIPVPYVRAGEPRYGPRRPCVTQGYRGSSDAARCYRVTPPDVARLIAGHQTRVTAGHVKNGAT